MISSKDWNDEFSFPITSDMVEPPMSRQSELRLHLVGGFPPESIIPDRQRMKPAAFKRLLTEVNKTVFGMEV